MDFEERGQCREVHPGIAGETLVRVLCLGAAFTAFAPASGNRTPAIATGADSKAAGLATISRRKSAETVDHAQQSNAVRG